MPAASKPLSNVFLPIVFGNLAEFGDELGKREGSWTFWLEDGQEGFEADYKDCKLDGLAISYIEDGTGKAARPSITAKKLKIDYMQDRRVYAETAIFSAQAIHSSRESAISWVVPSS